MVLESRTFTIEILGKGYAGVSTLIHLEERFGSRMAHGRLRPILLDRSTDPGPGLPWEGPVTSDRRLTNLHVGR